jgi:hypothetical protein
MERQRTTSQRTTETRRGAAPGRHDEPRSRPNHAHPIVTPPPLLRTPVAEMLRDLLGPMRWLGAPKGSDLSEALGGMPGDAGWLVQLPDAGGLLCITVSRRLSPATPHHEETRVVLFQELRGYGGFTWCLSAEAPDSLDRVRAEIESLLQGGATVLATGGLIK